MSTATQASEPNPFENFLGGLFDSSSGHLDTPMQKQNRDGRDPSVTSIFE